MILLGLLDLSAAFDCVDYDILFSRLHDRFGVRATAFNWTKSFLLGRSEQVFYKGHLSTILQLMYGVPHESVLGPNLFSLYIAEFFEVIAECGLTGYGYATWIYISAPATDQLAAIESFTRCIT